MKLLILFLAFLNPDLKEDVIRINKTYTLDNPREFNLVINNLYGSVQVEASDDDNIQLELEILISGRSEELIAKAKRELELGESFDSDSLILYSKAPFIKECRWGDFRGFDIRKHPDYKFRYQYKLKVPAEVAVYAKTITKGNILIKDMSGIVKACNVDGDVEIRNAHDVREASTVNGDVTIQFVKNPTESVSFNTVNGDFNFSLPNDFSAKVFFDSMNGDLYTAFDYKKIAPKVEKSDRHGSFKIGTKTGVEIGSGGPEFSFKSINGNVYLKKSR